MLRPYPWHIALQEDVGWSHDPLSQYFVYHHWPGAGADMAHASSLGRLAVRGEFASVRAALSSVRHGTLVAGGGMGNNKG